MNFPFVRRCDQQHSTRRQRARNFSQGAGGLLQMFDRDDVDRSVERSAAEWKRREIGKRIDAAIIPCRIAYREIDPAVSLARELMAVLPFPRSRI
jgi:hypothetical protein